MKAQLGGEIGALTSHRDHNSPPRRDTQAKPVESLPQERLPSGEYGILLGPVLAIDVPSEVSEPHAPAAGQYEGPRVRIPAQLGCNVYHARSLGNAHATREMGSMCTPSPGDFWRICDHAPSSRLRWSPGRPDVAVRIYWVICAPTV